MKQWSARAVLVPVLAVLCLACTATAQDEPAAPFDPGTVSFAVDYNTLSIHYRVLAVFALPAETLEFTIVDAAPERTFTLTAAGGELVYTAPRAWRWRTPDRPGLQPLVFTDDATGETLTLNLFVLVPIEAVERGVLNGYRIGDYPAKPYKGLEIYQRPAGFVEVTPELLDTPVAPHFTLGQFLCKQEDGFPKYLVLRSRLLLKLELLLLHVNEAGYRYDSFVVMSGYRTPHYNQGIGNVQYSRHVWGGAADVYLDEHPRDGNMDDLNRDGRIDVADAAVVYRIFDGLYDKPFFAKFIGGLGQYRATANHGPFVHVDVRGFRARWGD